MILASFNVQNLFERAKAMNLKSDDPNDKWQEGKSILDDFADFNDLLGKDTYTDQDKTEILNFIKVFGLEKEDTGKFVILRQNRGRLITRHGDGNIEVVASGRGDWIGWVELRTEPISDIAILNTGRVISDVNADVLAVVEADSRITLARFNEYVLPKIDGTPYDHVMLIDGNDDRGIDVGIMTRAGYPIELMRSHVDDPDGDNKIFSRDCPEYLIKTPNNNRLWVLVNHLKSKGSGTQKESNARRKKQAKRVRQIYDALIADGEKFVAVVGDMNDTPNSDPLSPLLSDGSTLKDISTHSQFDNGGRPGTYNNCTKSDKIDYILLSPELYKNVLKGGILRKGVWGGKNGTLWEIYKEMKKSTHAASDHAAIWAEIDI